MVGLTPAVPPIVTKVPALAMWLYGPIGIGVFGGVLVSTFGIGSSQRGDPSARCLRVAMIALVTMAT